MTNANEIYNDYLTKHFSHTADHQSFRKRKKLYLKHNYEKWFPRDAAANILDIGPGYGELIELLLKDYNYTNVRGVDISREVVNFCNEVIPNSAILVEDTTTYLAQQGQKFDLVFMLHILEHVPKQQIVPLLKNIYDALVPKGILIVEVPNMGDPLTGLNTRYADFTHEVGFTELSLSFVLSAAGFSNVAIRSNKAIPDRWFRSLQELFRTGLRLTYNVIQRAAGVRASRIITPTIYAVAIK